MSAATQGATRSARSRRAPDKLCVEAVDLARAALEEATDPGAVGEWIEAVADADRVVTHLFETREPGYRGWRWAVTVARASRAKNVTVDESVLLPGPDALMAPEWVPWNERLRPGDLGPGDLLPTDAEDLRLEPGFSGEDDPPPNSVVAEEAERVAETVGGVEDVADLELREGSPAVLGEATPLSPPPDRGSIAAVAEEMGVARPRVLSRYGLRAAADRWEDEYGPKSPMALAAPATCVSCGFLMALGGSLKQAFGVCANEYSPADGHVVSLAFGCGGHSEAAVMPRPPQPPPPVIDETLADPMSLRGPDQEPTQPDPADISTAPHP